jgi:CHAT domain-containing protein/Flp pilus assembly protein TadD
MRQPLQLIALASLLSVAIALPTLAQTPAPTPTPTTQPSNNRAAQILRDYKQGRALYRQKQYDQALQAFQQALKTAQELKEPDIIGELWAQIGYVYHDSNRVEAAIKAYQTALSYFKQVSGGDREFDVMVQLARAENYVGQYQSAIQRLNQVLQQAQQQNKPEYQYQAWINLGMIYNNIQRSAEAETVLQKAWELVKTDKNQARQHRVMNELALLALNRGNYAQAIERFQVAIQLAQQLKNSGLEQVALSNLGIAYYSVGEYRQAAKIYEQALQLARQNKDVEGEGKVLGSIGILYRATGQPEEALRFTQASLKIARQLRDLSEEKVSLMDLGLLYMELGRVSEAIATYEAALELAKRTQDESLEGKLYGNLGLLYGQSGDQRKALTMFRSSVAIAQKFQDLRERAVGLSNLGVTLNRLGEYREAEQHLRSAIQLWDQQRAELNRNQQYNVADRQKIALFERQNVTYRELQRTLAGQKQPEAALEVAEQAKSRALVELIERKKSTQNRQLEASNLTIAQLKQIAKSQNATIVEYSILADAITPPQTPPNDSPKNSPKNPSKQVVRDLDLYIWVIQPNGQVSLRQVDLRPGILNEKSNFEHLVNQSRDLIGARSRGVKISRAAQSVTTTPSSTNFQRLHQLLIEPIQDLLPKQAHEQVVIIPHKSLFNVPFYALQNAKGQYLIESHTLRVSPSIQVLGLSRSSTTTLGPLPTQFPNALVVGNPTMPKVQLEPDVPPEHLDALPNAEQEAKTVADLLQVPALTGDRAKKSVVLQQMKQAKLIHFATHGLLDDFRDLGIPGAIALAPDQPNRPNDGLLLSDELMDEQFKLNADLVVLSACNTGQGRITGDGVVGLSRSFIAAGVPSVLVSLWAVDDASTSYLMAEFYRNLAQSRDRAAALRQAMLATQKQYPDPYHWAAFTLVGQSGAD